MYLYPQAVNKPISELFRTQRISKWIALGSRSLENNPDWPHHESLGCYFVEMIYLGLHHITRKVIQYVTNHIQQSRQVTRNAMTAKRV